MKNVLFVTNVVFLGIILFMSCNKADLATAPAVIQPCNPCTDHTKTGFTGITANRAKSMFNDYRTMNQPLLQIAEGNDDANRIWFSLENLKNFIWKVEQEVCKHPCARPLKLGIRIYYGRYPADMNVPGLTDLPDEYAQHHTLFMVPTYQDAVNDNIQWDFDPLHWGNSTCMPTPLVDLFKNISPAGIPFGNQESMFFSIAEKQYCKNADGSISQWGIMNHGNMNPPPPPGNIDGSGFIP
jgi:hypothetical protein